MYGNIVRQLKTLRHGQVEPNEEWLKKNRELLLHQIKNTIGPKTAKPALENIWESMSMLLPHSFVYKILRPVTVMFLIVGMGIGGWIATVAASSESLPGEWLYPAKIATEQTQVAVANAVGDKSAQTNLHIEFARRRAIETKKIISTDNPDKMQIAAQTVSNLTNEMQNVSSNLEDIKTAPGTSAQVAQNVTQNAQQIGNVLQDVKASLLVNTSTENLSNQVAAANNLVSNTAVQAVEVMVVKNLQGDNSVSKEDVKQAITDQVQSAVADAAASQQNAQAVKNAVDVVQTEIKQITEDSKGANASTTQALTTRIDAAVKQTQAAVDKTVQIANETGQKATETQQLLSQDNLTQAVDTMKQLTSATQQAVQVSDNTIKAIQSVLPVVAVVQSDSTSSALSLTVTTTPVTTTLGVSTTVQLGTTTVIKVVTSTLPVTGSTGTTSTDKK